MSGVLNDYNQLEGEPRIRIGNWVEERALLSTTGHSRGSALGKNVDTATRITGPVLHERDYGTTTELALQHTLKAPHGPAFIQSIAPPRRNQLREAQRLIDAQNIMAAKEREAEEKKEAELRYASFEGRAPQNRKRAMADTKTVEECKEQHPLNEQAITFHTHHLNTIHGVTPTDRGVHTFSKNTHFSKPISELHETGER